MKNDVLVGQISDRKFDKLLVKFLLTEPFFSSIVRHMRKIKTKDIPTAGVAVVDDSISLYWNPDFIEKLTTKEFFGLLKHECYHLIFKHVTARKQDPRSHSSGFEGHLTRSTSSVGVTGCRNAKN